MKFKIAEKVIVVDDTIYMGLSDRKKVMGGRLPILVRITQKESKYRNTDFDYRIAPLEGIVSFGIYKDQIVKLTDIAKMLYT